MPSLEDVNDLIEELRRKKVYKWKEDQFDDLKIPFEKGDGETFVQNLNCRVQLLRDKDLSIQPKLSELIGKCKTMSNPPKPNARGRGRGRGRGRERGVTQEEMSMPERANLAVVGTGPGTDVSALTKNLQNTRAEYDFLSKAVTILSTAVENECFDQIDFKWPVTLSKELETNIAGLENIRRCLQVTSSRKPICEWLSSNLEKLSEATGKEIYDHDFKKDVPPKVTKAPDYLTNIQEKLKKLKQYKSKIHELTESQEMHKNWLEHIQQFMKASKPPKFEFHGSSNETCKLMTTIEDYMWGWVEIGRRLETEQAELKTEVKACFDQIESIAKPQDTTVSNLKSSVTLLRKRIEELTQGLNAKEAELKNEKENIRALTELKDELSRKITTVEDKLNATEAELKREKENIRELTKENDELSRKKATMEDNQLNLQDLDKKVQDYNVALHSLQSMCKDETRDTFRHDQKDQQKFNRSLKEPCDIQETVQTVELKISGLTKEIQELRHKVASCIHEIEKIGLTRGENASKTSRQMQDDVVCLLSDSIKGAQERVIDIKKRNDEEEAARRQQIQNCLENFKLIQETCQHNLQEREARSGRTAGRLKMKIDPENIESSGEYTINVLLRFSESYTELLDRNEKQREQILTLEKVNSKAEKTISDLRYRLSKHMGAELMTDNPNIADLSDSNRPTKLAESFSELYDNDWTNAYEELLTKMADTDAVTRLLDILKFAYEYCSEAADAQLSCLLVNVCTPAAIFEETRDEKQEKKTTEIDTLSKQAVNELRKKTFAVACRNLLKHSENTMKREGKWEATYKGKDCQKYIKSCIEICWLMNIQSPPVYIDFEIDKKGKFDDKTYKPYSKKGKKIDFVVWPPLYISKEGTLLAKGVAEGK